MKLKYIYLILSQFIFVKNVFSQENLIPNGTFEEKYSASWAPPTSEDPLIPCIWGGITNPSLGSPSPVKSWAKIGSANDNRAWNPDVFDSRRGDKCDAPNPQLNDCGYDLCTNNAFIGIPSNFYGNYLPHRLPITAGGFGRYVGLRQAPFDYANIIRPGIYCKLKKKLKANQLYHLRFYAIRAGGNGASHELEIRFCKSDSWTDESKLNNSQQKEIKKDVINTSTWELIDIPFSVNDCDVEYLMIRLNPKLNRKILLDDFELLEDCSVGKECSSTISDDIDNFAVNDEHNSSTPLTFSNLNPTKSLTIIIEKLVGVNSGFIPVRYYYLTNPPNTFSWDGLDMFGIQVPNGIYRYYAYYSNDCRCNEK